MVAVDDEEFALVVGNPCFVELVETLQVVQTDGSLVATSAFLNLRHQVRDRRTDINHQVGHLDQRHHQVKEVAVVVKIAVGHKALPMQIGCKDTCVLVDSTVLNNVIGSLAYLHHVFKTLIKEIDLQVKTPPLHIGVEVLQIRIKLHGFVTGFPTIMLGKHSCQRGLTTADISGDSYMHLF